MAKASGLCTIYVLAYNYQLFERIKAVSLLSKEEWWVCARELREVVSGRDATNSKTWSCESGGTAAHQAMGITVHYTAYILLINQWLSSSRATVCIRRGSNGPNYCSMVHVKRNCWGFHIRPAWLRTQWQAPLGLVEYSKFQPWSWSLMRMGM